VHSADSPDASLSDIFLFDYLKGEMVGLTANSSTDVFSQFHRIFQETSRESLLAVYDKCLTRLEWIAEHKVERYHTE
jgi:hypothetical protein